MNEMNDRCPQVIGSPFAEEHRRYFAKRGADRFRQLSLGELLALQHEGLEVLREALRANRVTTLYFALPDTAGRRRQRTRSPEVEEQSRYRRRPNYPGRAQILAQRTSEQVHSCWGSQAEPRATACR